MAYNARPACGRQGGRVVGIGRVGPKAGQTEGFYDFVMKFVRCKFDVASGCFSYIPSPPQHPLPPASLAISVSVVWLFWHALPALFRFGLLLSSCSVLRAPCLVLPAFNCQVVGNIIYGLPYRVMRWPVPFYSPAGAAAAPSASSSAYPCLLAGPSGLDCWPN